MGKAGKWERVKQNKLLRKNEKTFVNNSVPSISKYKTFKQKFNKLPQVKKTEIITQKLKKQEETDFCHKLLNDLRGRNRFKSTDKISNLCQFACCRKIFEKKGLSRKEKKRLLNKNSGKPKHNGRKKVRPKPMND